VSHKHARDRAEKHKSRSFSRLPHELWRQRIVLSVICPLPSVRVRSRGFPQMGGCYLFKYNGGDSVIKISVLYWRCSLITVSVIRGYTICRQDVTYGIVVYPSPDIHLQLFYFISRLRLRITMVSCLTAILSNEYSMNNNFFSANSSHTEISAPSG
jgi:hypothetical protein